MERGRTVVVGTGPVAEAAAAELGDALLVPDATALADPALLAGVPLALAVLVVGEEPVDEVVEGIVAAGHAGARILVVTERLELDQLSRTLDGGHLAGVVSAPWTPGNLLRYVEAQVERWARRPHAAAAGELLRHLRQAPEEAAAELLASVETVLGERPRLRVAPRVRLTTEDAAVDQLFLVLHGRVVLSVATKAGPLTLHHASTGPLIGLLALTGGKRAEVTARTSTECVVVPLTLEQLELALGQDPRVGTALTALTVRALTARLRRSERLHVSKAELAAELQAALRELEAARAGLVAQAQLVTLGETTAGVAHELSNPIAAVTSGVEHLAVDVRTLLGGGAAGGGGAAAREGDAAVLAALEAAEHRTPVSTSEERAVRRELSAATGADPALVRRLVAAGVTDPDAARALVAGPPDQLARVEAAAGIGATLRSLRTAAEHVGALVETLRAHARPEDPDAPLDHVDLPETLDAALRIVAHRLQDVRLEVVLDPDLPQVGGRPGRLTQVWANLLTNAADALDGHGRIAVRAERTPEGVRVQVEDDGPGVPALLQQRIFEPRFTTKRGVVRSGLGLGLSISRSIVVQHGGTIALDSRPGRTVFTVDLPALLGIPATPGLPAPGPSAKEQR
ncbi:MULTISPECIES: sensor histidine kinase [unclassified Ornithinimicrobium]|uniref:sensor histidine kinase n=1 Tax=unclassified Ornithinimicrobium TaxID=2615080 RepID=UPI003851A860